MTAPLHLLIAIHYHTSGSGEDYAAGTAHGESQGTLDCISDLIEAGLLQRQRLSGAPRKFEPTDGMAVFIDALCCVPFPELKWVMPREKHNP